MSRVEGGKRTNAPSANPDEVNQTQVNQIEVDKTEQQRLVDAFWEIYDNNNQDEIDRQALCEHIICFNTIACFNAMASCSILC